MVYDRFIPVRSGMDFGYVLTELTWAKAAGASRRLLAFNDRPKEDPFMLYASNLGRGKAPAVAGADGVLDAPGLRDDENGNLMDWGSENQLAVALGGTVHFLAMGSSTDSSIEAGGEVSCVKWAPVGHHIAIAAENSIQLWDFRGGRLVRTLGEGLGSRVGAMSWNGNILSSGGSDGSLVISDPRLENSAVCVYNARGTSRGICSLSWSGTGHQLASGCSHVYIWDARSQTTRRPWIHRLTAEVKGGGVRALAWCPLRDGTLASGASGCIKFWSTRAGNCINTLKTGSGPVLSLAWSKSQLLLLPLCRQCDVHLGLPLAVHR